MKNDYEDRANEFGASYEGGEQREITDLIVATGEWLERLLLSSSAASAAMKAMYVEIVGANEQTADPNVTWRALWEEHDATGVSETMTCQIILALHAFAFWGLRPDLSSFSPDADANIAFAIEHCISRLREMLDSAPQGWAHQDEIERTVLGAEARIRLDTGRDVTPEQLSALAGISLKSMKNLLAPKSGSADLRLNGNGEIARSEAALWIEARSDFKSSVWNEEIRKTSDCDDEADNHTLDDVVFVPIAKDGSWFDPVTCRSNRGYTIGPKGSEQPVSDYHEALQQLARMKTPYWRRPNAAGNWGLVAGNSWQRHEVSELDRLTTPYADARL